MNKKKKFDKGELGSCTFYLLSSVPMERTFPKIHFFWMLWLQIMTTTEQHPIMHINFINAQHAIQAEQ